MSSNGAPSTRQVGPPFQQWSLVSDAVHCPVQSWLLYAAPRQSESKSPVTVSAWGIRDLITLQYAYLDAQVSFQTP